MGEGAELAQIDRKEEPGWDLDRSRSLSLPPLPLSSPPMCTHGSCCRSHLWPHSCGHVYLPDAGLWELEKAVAHLLLGIPGPCGLHWRQELPRGQGFAAEVAAQMIPCCTHGSPSGERGDGANGLSTHPPLQGAPAGRSQDPASNWEGCFPSLPSHARCSPLPEPCMPCPTTVPPACPCLVSGVF